MYYVEIKRQKSKIPGQQNPRKEIFKTIHLQQKNIQILYWIAEMALNI